MALDVWAVLQRAPALHITEEDHPERLIEGFNSELSEGMSQWTLVSSPAGSAGKAWRQEYDE